MKRIDLGRGYAIDIDSINYTLKKDVRINTKEKIEVLDNGETKKSLVEYEASNVVGYYSSLESILKAYYKEKVIDTLGEKQTLNEALNVLKDVKQYVEKQFEGIRL